MEEQESALPIPLLTKYRNRSEDQKEKRLEKQQSELKQASKDITKIVALLFDDSSSLFTMTGKARINMLANQFICGLHFHSLSCVEKRLETQVKSVQYVQSICASGNTYQHQIPHMNTWGTIIKCKISFHNMLSSNMWRLNMPWHVMHHHLYHVLVPVVLVPVWVPSKTAVQKTKYQKFDEHTFQNSR